MVQLLKIVYVLYDRMMFLVSWGRISPSWIRDSPRTNALKTDTRHVDSENWTIRHISYLFVYATMYSRESRFWQYII